ncbi:MAG: cysteine synthase family protein [Marinifilaceae bacterium]|jgi:cysteine synthase B|nr:cysteine synthase family protein [Marinilabiliaceae bacterium JC040]MCT4600484.1 cysteine synthase family protein [Marinifilaceae bacterium]
MIRENILETIGGTPMVKINSINPKPESINIYAKLEGFNPTGSIKDRIAIKMLEEAEKSGALISGKTIIEPTSGNTGIGLAIASIVKGYKLIIVMSEAVSIERRTILKSYGVEIILTEAKYGTDGAIRKVHEIVNEDPNQYYFPNQFSNSNNYMAHYASTAEEIWNDTNGDIDYFVASLGTSGTIMGIGKYFKKYKPDVKIVEAHPILGHYIQGLKNMEEAIVPSIYDTSIIDISEMIESEEAFEMSRKIIKEEGIFAGMSSGAAMLAAYRLAQRIERGNIVVIFPDRAEKYLSTDLFKF